MSNRNKNQFTDLTYSRFFMMLLQFKGFLDYIESFSISFEQAYYDRRSFHRLLRLFKHYQKTHKDIFDFSDICKDDYDYHQIYCLILKPFIYEKTKKNPRT